MAIYVYTNSPGEEWQPLIPGDYTLLRWPCDEGFHVPLIEERQAIMTSWLNTSQFKSYLHIPLAGFRDKDGSWNNGNSYAYLRTSSPDGSLSKRFRFDNAYSYSNSTDRRSFGFSIRWFRDTPIIPDSNRTETVTGKMWYISTLWLISILVWMNQYVTMQDKNVWATVVWNDWDAITNDNRWKYFQWWNNYGFTYWSTWDTSSTLVDASSYWPNNPYSSSTFITTSDIPYDRSNPRNDNLRWYTDFNS